MIRKFITHDTFGLAIGMAICYVLETSAAKLGISKLHFYSGIAILWIIAGLCITVPSTVRPKMLGAVGCEQRPFNRITVGSFIGGTLLMPLLLVMSPWEWFKKKVAP